MILMITNKNTYSDIDEHCRDSNSPVDCAWLEVELVQPSSAVAEHVFSILTNFRIHDAICGALVQFGCMVSPQRYVCICVCL